MSKIARGRNNAAGGAAMLRDLRKAIEDQCRVLILAFNNEEICRILRVEVDYAHEMVIKRASPEYWMHQKSSDRIGPWTFSGVDVYAVRKLPGPGWRVVNPFDVD